MNEKHKSILRLLNNDNEWISARNLAEALNVTERSIKNYIKQINELYHDIILSSRQGYRLITDFSMVNINDDTVPQTINERINYILWKLLIQKENPDIFDLCDELFISDNTIKADLIKVRRKLHNWDLDLINRNNILSVEGSERNRRRLISHIMYAESKQNFMNLDKIQSSFPHYDVKKIEKIIKDTLFEYHYYVNNFVLVNIILHIVIAINSISERKIISETISNIQSTEYKVAKSITDKLEQIFFVQFNDSEIYELSLKLLGNLTILTTSKQDTTFLINNIDKKYLNLVNILIKDMQEHYFLQFEDENFRVRFALHLKNLIYRATNHFQSRNPLTSDIKLRNPFIYDCAVHLSHRIIEEYHYTFDISNDEIAYIAFHIGNEIEIQRTKDKVVYAILFYPQYYDFSNQFLEQIHQKYANKLVITNVVQDYSQIENFTFDFIISIVPLNVKNKSVVVVSPFLNETDIKKISKKIENIQHLKYVTFLNKNLTKIFNKDLFEKNNYLKSDKEVIPHVCRKLTKLHYVRDSFESEIYDREKMSSTAFHDIAIPHSIKMNAKKTGMFIFINNDGIQWGENTVHMVIFLAISKEERKIFRDLFDILTTVFTDTKIKKTLLNINTYDEFRKHLIDSFKNKEM